MRLLTAFEPIWLLAAAGYLTRRTGLLGDGAVSVLGWFVFHLAIPAALFLTLARTPLSGLGARPLIAFGASTVAVIGLGWYGAGRFFGRKRGEQAICGMVGGYVNSANLGIPIAMQVLGSVSFLVEVVLFQVLVVSPIILTVLDRHADAASRIRFARIVSLPVRNPVIMASVSGACAAAAGVRLPSALAGALGLVSTVAVPAALVALGASLHSKQPHLDVAHREVATITVLKLAVQPAVAYVIGHFVLHLPHPELSAVIVCAALPTAQNVFVFAHEYGTAEALASRAMLTTTTLSLASIAAIVPLIGR